MFSNDDQPALGLGPTLDDNIYANIILILWPFDLLSCYLLLFAISKVSLVLILSSKSKFLANSLNLCVLSSISHDFREDIGIELYSESYSLVFRQNSA
jgi:hypothetical protein